MWMHFAIYGTQIAEIPISITGREDSQLVLGGLGRLPSSKNFNQECAYE